MNAGERDEILIKLSLVALRDNNQSINNIQIKSVGFNGIEYGILPSSVANNFIFLSDTQLEQLAFSMGISKSGVFNKSDVYINNIGFSLKSYSAAPPALVNHTARPGFENICKKVNVNIMDLDILVDQYWDLRLNGVISEDVRNSNPNSPFIKSKSILKPILEYFLFIGSGSRTSKHPAEYILEFSDPCDSSTWNIINPSTAVDLLWDNLVFSIRSKKGMPKNYDMNTYSKSDASSIALWTRYTSGDYRGALHIRSHR